MEELFSKALSAIVPWLIPLVLIASWLVNHGYGSPISKDKGDKSTNASKETKEEKTGKSASDNPSGQDS